MPPWQAARSSGRRLGERPGEEGLRRGSAARSCMDYGLEPERRKATDTAQTGLGSEAAETGRLVPKGRGSVGSDPGSV